MYFVSYQQRFPHSYQQFMNTTPNLSLNITPNVLGNIHQLQAALKGTTL